MGSSSAEETKHEQSRSSISCYEVFKAEQLKANNSNSVRIVCISDTFGRHQELCRSSSCFDPSDSDLDAAASGVPDGDILIHCGNFSADGDLVIVRAFNEFLGKLPHKHKIVVCGPHDNLRHLTRCQIQTELLTNAIYLQDSWVQVEGLKIYGTPFQSTGAWKKSGEKLVNKYKRIPEDTDVLVTNTPCFNVLDLKRTAAFVETSTSSSPASPTFPSSSSASNQVCEDCGSVHNFQTHCGEPELYFQIMGRIRPLVHVFGRVPENHGIVQQFPSGSVAPVTFVNSALEASVLKRPAVLSVPVLEDHAKAALFGPVAPWASCPNDLCDLHDSEDEDEEIYESRESRAAALAAQEASSTAFVIQSQLNGLILATNKKSELVLVDLPTNKAAFTKEMLWVISEEDGYISSYSNYHVLENTDGSFSEGATVSLSEAKGFCFQKWVYKSQSGQLVNKMDNRALQASTKTVRSKEKLELKMAALQQAPNISKNQIWRIVPLCKVPLPTSLPSLLPSTPSRQTKKNRPGYIFSDKIVAIGDLHGQFDKLCSLWRNLENTLKEEMSDYTFVFLGDIVDRGPNVKETIDWIIKQKQHYDIRCVSGNHDFGMTAFLGLVDFPRDFQPASTYSHLKEHHLAALWRGRHGEEQLMHLQGRRWGALEDYESRSSVESYGVDSSLPMHELRQELLAKVPASHKEFLKSLPLVLESDNYVFVHAGIDTELHFENQLEKLYTKECITKSNISQISKRTYLQPEGHPQSHKTIVSGHVAFENVVIRKRRILVDTTGGLASGNLSAIILPLCKIVQS